ncbi:solute carrier family 13 member 1 [Sparus aurata]|uniref:solute carrier family 13 member 1 n=1 Tax=Sparus aurata TaxID=8175 RepID=UPI0011C194EB|nr:solute carrier family 13 member 1 [Sparus aurata]
MLSRLSRGWWNYRSLVLIVLTPLLLLPLPLVVRTKEAECAFVLLLMATFWVTEVIPLPMTAMLPAVLFPMFGIMKASDVAQEYLKNYQLLLVGVICLATSINKWGLNRRIALRLVTMLGVNPAWLMLGFMSICAFLSLWVQNTLAVTMVMPIVEAVLQQIVKDKQGGCVGEDNPNLQLEETDGHVETVPVPVSEQKHPDVPEELFTCVQTHTVSQATSLSALPNQPRDTAKVVAVAQTAAASRSKQDLMICKAICLSIVYSSSIGGMSTLPGSSPNLIFSEYLNQIYPDCSSVNFGNWLLLSLPVSVIMLLLTWLWLTWLFIGSDFRSLWRCGGEPSESEAATREVIEKQYRSLGPMSSQEMFTGGVFLVMVLLWLTRSPGFMPGWASLLPHHSGYITDATVALLLGLLFFIVPAYGPSRTYEAMISWGEFQAAMPWKVVLLVGGGFALAEGTKVSGLSLWLAKLLTPLGGLPVLATITVACIIVTTVTQVASNATVVTVFLPILSPLAEAIHVNPLYVLIPSTLCTSFSFLLPVSNNTNAIIFAYGYLNIIDMVKAGLGAAMIGIPVVLLAVVTLGAPLFSLDTYPDWAPDLPGFNSTAL